MVEKTLIVLFVVDILLFADVYYDDNKNENEINLISIVLIEKRILVIQIFRFVSGSVGYDYLDSLEIKMLKYCASDFSMLISNECTKSAY